MWPETAWTLEILQDHSWLKSSFANEELNHQLPSEDSEKPCVYTGKVKFGFLQFHVSSRCANFLR